MVSLVASILQLLGVVRYRAKEEVMFSAAEGYLQVTNNLQEDIESFDQLTKASKSAVTWKSDNIKGFSKMVGMLESRLVQHLAEVEGLSLQSSGGTLSIDEKRAINEVFLKLADLKLKIGELSKIKFSDRGKKIDKKSVEDIKVQIRELEYIKESLIVKIMDAYLSKLTEERKAKRMTMDTGRVRGSRAMRPLPPTPSKQKGEKAEEAQQGAIAHFETISIRNMMHAVHDLSRRFAEEMTHENFGQLLYDELQAGSEYYGFLQNIGEVSQKIDEILKTSSGRKDAALENLGRELSEFKSVFTENFGGKSEIYKILRSEERSVEESLKTMPHAKEPRTPESFETKNLDSLMNFVVIINGHINSLLEKVQKHS